MGKIKLPRQSTRVRFKKTKGETVRDILHAPCRFVFSSMIFQWSDEHIAPVAWTTSAGNHQFQTVDVKRQLSRLTEGSKRKSTIPMHYIKIKCQRMVGQCPACPIGRAVADTCALKAKVHNSWHFFVLDVWCRTTSVFFVCVTLFTFLHHSPGTIKARTRHIRIKKWFTFFFIKSSGSP